MNKFISEGDRKMRKIKQQIDVMQNITAVSGSEPVIVQSRRVNNAAVGIRFNKIIRKGMGGQPEERWLSRTYTFTNFHARIPFKLAKQLVSDNPNDFTIVGPVDESLDILKQRIDEFNSQMDAKLEKATKKHICKDCSREFQNPMLLGKHRKKEHPVTESVKVKQEFACAAHICKL